jgi:hypothetical protein
MGYYVSASTHLTYGIALPCAEAVILYLLSPTFAFGTLILPCTTTGTNEYYVKAIH